MAKVCRIHNENFSINKQILKSKQHSKSNSLTSTQYVDNQEDDCEILLTTNKEISKFRCHQRADEKGL